MLRGILNNQNMILDDQVDLSLVKQWTQKELIKCPVCGGSYELCMGKIIRPYFRHKDKAECEYEYYEEETEEHKNGKLYLYEWLNTQERVENIILEDWFPETKQRPDISFQMDGQQYVIEYQCSPISSEYIERHELYKAAGIKDIWICGVNNYFQCFHNGAGFKRLNYLEKESGLYFYSDKKIICQRLKLTSADFNSFYNDSIYGNIIFSFDEYNPFLPNYIKAKDKSISMSSYSYYPSPSGKSSNRYPYKVTEYKYFNNYSILRCIDLKDVKM